MMGSAGTEICREVQVINRNGIHVRPSTLIVQTASGFSADIRIRRGDQTANAKSILEILEMGVVCGETLKIEATGKQAKKAVKSLEQLIKNRFGFED
jgi:phosphotransferase system HPr (HPr) family protein